MGSENTQLFEVVNDQKILVVKKVVANMRELHLSYRMQLSRQAAAQMTSW